MKKWAMLAVPALIAGAVWGFFGTKSDESEIEKLVLTGSSP